MPICIYKVTASDVVQIVPDPTVPGQDCAANPVGDMALFLSESNFHVSWKTNGKTHDVKAGDTNLEGAGITYTKGWFAKSGETGAFPQTFKIERGLLGLGKVTDVTVSYAPCSNCLPLTSRGNLDGRVIIQLPDYRSHFFIEQAIVLSTGIVMGIALAWLTRRLFIGTPRPGSIGPR